MVAHGYLPSRFCRGVVAALANVAFVLAAADGAEPFSKIWLGKDLWQFGGGKYPGGSTDWRSMPGATVSLGYSGKGELPPPVEFNIEMDRPLPMGEYHVFVKNFYRGKMEITLGNVTRPAQVKRYDWTPAVPFEIMTPADQPKRIVLRYFPTMPKDSGVKETQGYIIQGVFITSDKHEQPFEEGRIIRLKPRSAFVSRPGNCLQGASFESGFGHGWGKSVGTFLILGPQNLDSTTAAHGKYSLKIPLFGARAGYTLPLESRFYELNPEKKHTLSVWLKADRPVQVTAGLTALPKDLSRSQGHGGLGTTFDIGTQWARYSVTGEPNKEVAAYLYGVQFSAKETAPATVWIDAVQLEEGDATPFKPQRDVEVGWVCPVPGHIYYDTEPAPLTLRFYNPQELATATLQCAVEDYYGATVDKQTRAVEFGRRTNVDFPLDLYKARRGIFRATFRCGKGPETEMVYAVLPPNPHLNVLYPDGTLGADTGAPAEGLRILKRANFNWIMSKSVVRWYAVEPERGQYQFDDSLVKDAHGEKLMVMLQFLNPEWGRQAWLKPLAKVHHQAVWPEPLRQQYLAAWSDYIKASVAHYRPWVRHFEIENEPNAGWLPDDYGHLLKTAHAAAKAANPEVVVIGFAGGGFSEKYYEDAIAVAGRSSFDIASTHFYHTNADVHASFDRFLKKHGCPGWNTETGPSCPSLYASLPTFDSVTREDYRATTLDFIRKTTRQNTNNYLMTMSIGGMEKYMYYFCRFVNSSPTQPQLRQGSTKDCVEFDGALRANGAAVSIASHFLDGAKYLGPWSKEAVEAHLFARGRQIVGFLWLKDGRSVAPRGGELALYDIMGNPLDVGKPHRPADGPVYFTYPGGREGAAASLAGLDVN